VKNACYLTLSCLISHKKKPASLLHRASQSKQAITILRNFEKNGKTNNFLQGGLKSKLGHLSTEAVEV
jgi:hypothetical protein